MRITVSVTTTRRPSALLLPMLATGGSFVEFESGQVRPLALSPDGSRLFAVNAPPS